MADGGLTVPWYRGISFKVAAVIVALVVATVAISGLVFFTTVRGYAERVLASRGRYIATTLAQQAVEPILYEDRVALLRLLEAFQRQGDQEAGEASIVDYAEIVDRDGRPMAVAGQPPVWPRGGRSGVGARVVDGGGLVFEVVAPVVVKGVQVGRVRVGITRAQARAQLRRLGWQIAALLVAAAALAIATTLILSRRIIRPLLQVIHGARRIGEGGWGTRIEVPRRDETGELAATFNEMSARLKEAFDEIHRTQAQLIQSERFSTLGSFAAHLAHELKNPLTSIKLSMQAMGEGGSGCLDAEERELILDDVAHMDEVITSFLAYGRRRPVAPVAVEVGPLLEEIGRRLVARGRQAQVAVELQIAPDLGKVQLDPERIEEAVENVVTNAIQVSPRGATVVVCASRTGDGGGLCIEVADQGPGMDAEVQAHLFEPFYTTRHGGTGLGLAIAQQGVSEHGGRIEVESMPGKGTVVAIVLPVEPPGGGSGEGQ